MDKKIYIGFDIDETLIHSIDIKIDQKPHENTDFKIKDKDSGVYMFSTYIRPNANLLLNYIKNNYEMFFYTRATKNYSLAILEEFGMNNEKLFHSNHIETEVIYTLYEGYKTFKVKRLDEIAKELNINVNQIIFIDDIKNEYEIIPQNKVIQVPAYYGSESDNTMTKLLKKFQECKDLDISELREELKSLNLMNIKNKSTNKKKI